jgi:hypothetical protein
MSHRSRECAAAGDIRGAVPHVAALMRATGVLAEIAERKKKRLNAIQHDKPHIEARPDKLESSALFGAQKRSIA